MYTKLKPSLLNRVIFPQAKISLKLFNKTRTHKSFISNKTKRIYSIIERANFTEGHLIVTYGKGLTNRGVYVSKKDLTYALKIFTQKSLVDYVKRSFNEW